MIWKSTLVFLSFLFYGHSAIAGVVFTSLPNPNVYPMFVIVDQQYLAAEFIPARGGPASLLALLISGKANVTVLNEIAAKRMVDRHNWTLMDATIVKAVHLLSYTPVESSADIDKLQIISAFPGGSPGQIFQAGNFSVMPKFTDPFLAIQLFQKKDFNAILLPEPYISQIIAIMHDRGETVYQTDIQLLALQREQFPLNAGVIRKEIDAEQVRTAFAKAVAFIQQHPDRAARIVSESFQKYFHINLPTTTIAAALNSGRLRFAMEKRH